MVQVSEFIGKLIEKTLAKEIVWKSFQDDGEPINSGFLEHIKNYNNEWSSVGGYGNYYVNTKTGNIYVFYTAQKDIVDRTTSFERSIWIQTNDDSMPIPVAAGSDYPSEISGLVGAIEGFMTTIDFMVGTAEAQLFIDNYLKS